MVQAGVHGSGGQRHSEAVYFSIDEQQGRVYNVRVLFLEIMTMSNKVIRAFIQDALERKNHAPTHDQPFIYNIAASNLIDVDSIRSELYNMICDSQLHFMRADDGKFVIIGSTWHYSALVLSDVERALYDMGSGSLGDIIEALKERYAGKTLLINRCLYKLYRSGKIKVHNYGGDYIYKWVA